jgi:hypothetical protein
MSYLSVVSWWVLWMNFCTAYFDPTAAVLLDGVRDIPELPDQNWTIVQKSGRSLSVTI